MPISRKTFLLHLTGAGWLLGSCGGGGDDNNSGNPPPGGGCAATIDGNHGHTLAIPAADLDSTTPKTYDIQGTATHSHSVTFSAAQLAQLKAGATVAVTSTPGASDNHSHGVSERCT